MSVIVEGSGDSAEPLGRATKSRIFSEVGSFKPRLKSVLSEPPFRKMWPNTGLRFQLLVRGYFSDSPVASNYVQALPESVAGQGHVDSHGRLVECPGVVDQAPRRGPGRPGQMEPGETRQ